MNVDLGIWGKLARFILGLLCLAILIGVGLWYRPLIDSNQRWRKRDLELEKQIRQEEKTAEQLKASITSMQDPKTVERLAREKLGYAKPGETVIRFETAPTDNSNSRP